MRKLLRTSLALVVAAIVVAVPSMASAATPSPDPAQYGCLVAEGATAAPDADTYLPPRACELHVLHKQPVCDNDVPRLAYEVEAIGTPNTTVTVTFVNPHGDDYVVRDLPLSGSVPWPGAVVKDGKGVDWPGWRQLADGTWVEGDEFDWVRPDVEVLFEVNPSATVTVAYPPSSPQCLTGPPGSAVLADEPGTPTSGGSAPLAATGSNALPIALAGAGLLVVGVLVLLVSRRRREPQA